MLAAILTVLYALLLPSVHRGRNGALRSQCKNNLLQIGLALRQYVDAYQALPPAYTVDSDGRPLHSWRTLILPYLDQKPLYDSIDLTKPWSDPANAEAFQTRLDVYRCPSFPGPDTQTIYMAVVAAESCLRAGEPRFMSDIKDGASMTLMIIEVPVDHAVHWMSPFDADEQLILGLSTDSKTAHAGGLQATLCDGSIRFISDKLPSETRRALITIAGGEKVEDF
ncbi:MAG: DUF1559 domain-containing protein [Planctomycetales bacterium]